MSLSVFCLFILQITEHDARIRVLTEIEPEWYVHTPMLGDHGLKMMVTLQGYWNMGTNFETVMRSVRSVRQNGSITYLVHAI